MTAFKASNRLSEHYSALNRSVQRLSSGKRLNTSADSPVDMAVHNVNNGRLATLAKGKQNIHDAISMVQTAESAMARIDDLLIQMKVMAEQAATGTYTNEQRLILASEFGQFASEIDRIARYTEFKGTKLIDGSISARNNIQRQGRFHSTDRKRVTPDQIDPAQDGLKIHFGPGNNRLEDYYFIRIGDLTMDGLLKDVAPIGASSTKKISISTQHAAQVALETINTAMMKKESNRYLMGIMQNRLEASLGFMDDEMLHLATTNSILADTDIAMEMTEFSRRMMLSEAASAMVSQANILPKIALKLLSF
jgi:flagellin